MRSITDILGRGAVEVVLAGKKLLLDPSGAIYWPSERLLLVSDLHLEKASFLAQFGAAIPQYDSRDTLHRLRQLTLHYAPEQIVCLGDSFHDGRAVSRLSPDDMAELEMLVKSCGEWHWILGNHDPALQVGLPGLAASQKMLGEILLTHEPDTSPCPQIIGHYHPKVTLKLGGSRVSGRCFLLSEKLLVMPAFGSFAGGLDSGEPAITALSPQPFQRYLLYKAKIWKV